MGKISRRRLLQAGGLALISSAVGLTAKQLPALSSDAGPALPALVPREPNGHQFVVYADCCSGIPGSPTERNFATVNAVVARIQPQPEFICFPGDHIAGYTKDYKALRSQWDYWLHYEMSWIKDRRIPIFHTTSNHNTYDPGSEQVFREVFPDIPRNGPPGQEGLSYYVRRGNLLLVCSNNAYSAMGGAGHVESEWLDQVLTKNADATFKLVAGHHPIFPVNGYTRYPMWRVVPDQGEAFWKVLVHHKVLAFLCSHIIAFDVQVHDGVLQITTGGAGTNFGPGGFMPGRMEYLHAVQMAVDTKGLRYQVLDTQGRIREGLDWPFILPSTGRWEILDKDAAVKLRGREKQTSGARLDVWRFTGEGPGVNPEFEAQTLLCGWDDSETAATLWIGFEGAPARLVVRLLPESGGGEQVWNGPRIPSDRPFDFQVGLHTGMGPGGVLFRSGEIAPWSSLTSSAAKGAEDLVWPRNWALGNSQSGPTERPFLGQNLKVSWTTHLLRS